MPVLPFENKRPVLDQFMNELFTPVLIHLDKPSESTMSPLTPIDDKKAQVSITEDKFLIRLNTDGYTPEELSVKIFDNLIMIVGLHEEMLPNSQELKTFFKKWAIPDRVQMDHIYCRLNSKTGDLVVQAPRIKEVDKNNNGHTD